MTHEIAVVEEEPVVTNYHDAVYDFTAEGCRRIKALSDAEFEEACSAAGSPPRFLMEHARGLW